MPELVSFLFFDLLFESLARESCSCYVSQPIRTHEQQERISRRCQLSSQGNTYYSLFETLHIDSFHLNRCQGV